MQFYFVLNYSEIDQVGLVVNSQAVGNFLH